MNAIVHAFKSSMTQVAGRVWVLPRAWQLRGMMCLVSLIVLSALALVYIKDTNRLLLADTESVRVSVEAQRWQHDELLVQRGQLLRADVLASKARALNMDMPSHIQFIEVLN